jgi:sarcosine oxidase, subunit beta
MTGVVETEICVVGGGVLGGFTALSLAEQGLSVVLVERGHPGSGASGANPGTVALQNKHLGAIPLVLKSLNSWERVADRLGTDVEYERRGGLRLAETDADVEKLERAVVTQREAGVETELILQPQLASEASYLGRTVRAATFCAADGMADPLKTMRGLIRRLPELGVEIWTECPVRRIETLDDDDLRVVTDRGTVKASSVVCAAGAWTRRLLAPLGVDLPLTHEVMITSITDQAPQIFPHVLTHVRGHLTLKQQRTTGKVLIGGGWHGEGELESGVHHVNHQNLKENLRLATSIVPRLSNLQVIRSWSGIEGRSPDRLLVMGPVGPRGLFVLCAAAGGFTISPFAGELAARWVMRGDPGWPVDSYNVQRFEMTMNQSST